MAKFGDSLRGYAHEVLKRDKFVCRYCGLDGKKWPNWLHLSWDHLTPKGHPQRNNPEFIVAACRFCNEAHNRDKWPVEEKSPDQLVDQKKPSVLAKRDEYKKFWEENVNSK